MGTKHAILSAVMAGALAVAAVAAAGEPLEAARKARDGGAAWLVKQQNADGSYGEAKGPVVGVTAMVAAALAEAGRTGPEVSKAVEFILKNRQEDGSICVKGGGFESYETALAIMALAAADKEKNKDAIAKAKDYLIGIQDDGAKNPKSAGGIGYGSDKTQSNMSTTHFALQALKEAGVPEDSDVWKRAIAFVSACQNDSETNSAEWAAVVNDGGFIYSPTESKAGKVEVRGKTGWRSYGSMTYAGYLSYAYAKVGADDPRVKGVLTWISNNYTLEENPGVAKQGLYYYYLTFATAMAARSQPLLKDKGGKEHDWAAELGAKLASLQDAEGWWLNTADRWHEGSKVLCTAYAVRALNKALAAPRPAAPAARPALDPAVDALHRAL